MDQTKAPGPLADIVVLELGGIGPLPLLAMLFADLGARIIRVDPVAPLATRIGPHLWIFRGQESLTVDLRTDAGREVLFRLVESADVLVEGYRADRKRNRELAAEWQPLEDEAWPAGRR